jgi:hypothetical protein
VCITTDLTRIPDCIGTIEQLDHQTPDHVAIRMEHSEVIDREPNPQELLALLGALAIHDRLECKAHTDQRIGLDCKSLVDYVNDYRHTRMWNEVDKLPFLLAIQKYLRQNESQEIRWVRSHPERRKPDEMEYDLDEWEYI